MSFDRAANDLVRLRRQFQGMAAGTSGYVFGDGLEFDPSSGTISIDLAAISGLEFTAGELRIDIGQNPSILAIDATGLITQFITVSGSLANGEVSILATGTGTMTIRSGNASAAVKLGTSTIDHLNGTGTAVTLSANGDITVSPLEDSAGRVTITGANANTTGAAGDMIIQGGDEVGFASAVGGFLTIRGGNSLTTNGGDLTITGGNGTPPGAFTLAGGFAFGGTGGSATVKGGSTSSGVGGAINVLGGDAAGVNQNAGAAMLRGGKPTGTGTSVASVEVTTSGGAATDRITCTLVGVGIGNVTSPTARLHIQAGTTTASTAPIKINSGSLLTAAEAGAIEFLTDDLYFTITTGTARKIIALLDGTLTAGSVLFATTNGRLEDDNANFFWDDTNDRLGLGTTGPTQQLDMTGTLRVRTAGQGVNIAEGTNARMGTAVLVAGTVVVNTTAVTANSRIFLTAQVLGTVAIASALAVTARTAGTSFTITASAATDTSTVAWLIMEPA